MDREQAKQEALRRAKRKKMGRRGPPVPTRQGQIDRPRMDRLTAGQLERLKRTQNRTRAKTTISRSHRSRHVNRWPS